MKTGKESQKLFQRASKVIPGGIYGHTSPISGLPDVFPYYCRRAQGCTFEDVDGRVWIDYMCGYGALLHGYLHPEVEAAVTLQRESGSVFNQPAEIMVKLAEKITEIIDFAQWCVFAKNGSDLTTWAVRVARQHTGRSIVIKAAGAYHGVDAWCDPGFGGRIPSDREHVLEFQWNDLDELKDLMSKLSDKVACLILTPFHHPSFGASVLPQDGFWSGVRDLCEKYGVILILDDVRCGGRLDDGGSHKYFNFSPELAIYSKALGNGYAISSCVGRDFLRKASMEVFLTGSCWNDAIAMSAAFASLEISLRNSVAQNVLNKGRDFCSGIKKIAAKNGFSLSMTGPSSMPYPYFDEDSDLFLLQKFCRLAAQEGLFFHPHHNWFISNALDIEMISETLKRTENVFSLLAS